MVAVTKTDDATSQDRADFAQVGRDRRLGVGATATWLWVGHKGTYLRRSGIVGAHMGKFRECLLSFVASFIHKVPFTADSDDKA